MRWIPGEEALLSRVRRRFALLPVRVFDSSQQRTVCVWLEWYTKHERYGLAGWYVESLRCAP